MPGDTTLWAVSEKEKKMEDPFSVIETGPAVEGKVVVAESSDGKVVLTFKGGRDFDAPWIVIHATSLEDAYEQVTTKGELLGKLMDRVTNAGKHFSGNGGSAGHSPGGGAPPRRAPQGAKEPPAGAPEKPYDDFVYMTGTSNKTGRVWHAWMPPEKGDSREPLFFNSR